MNMNELRQYFLFVLAMVFPALAYGALVHLITMESEFPWVIPFSFGVSILYINIRIVAELGKIEDVSSFSTLRYRIYYFVFSFIVFVFYLIGLFILPVLVHTVFY